MPLKHKHTPGGSASESQTMTNGGPSSAIDLSQTVGGPSDDMQDGGPSSAIDLASAHDGHDDAAEMPDAKVAEPVEQRSAPSSSLSSPPRPPQPPQMLGEMLKKASEQQLARYFATRQG